MKKRSFAVLLLAAVLLLSSCGGRKAEKLDVEKLLSADSEAEYIFAMAGLSTDDAKPLTAPDGGVYYPVQSEKYKTLADLNALLEGTYSEKIAIEAWMGTVDRNGRALYVDLEGRLCRSGEPMVGTASPEADYDTTEKQKAEKGEDGRQHVLFSFTENGADGSVYRCTMEAVEGKDGKWRLRAPRGTTPRETVKQGSGGAVADNVAEVADLFTKALTAGDTAAIERLTGAQGGSYSHLTATEVTSCQTVEEMDSEGEYLVTLEGKDGSGPFPQGQSVWRMEVGYADYDETLVVRYFQPSTANHYDRLPMEEQTNVAASQVTYLTRLCGNTRFNAPGELPKEVIAEYALWMEELQNGPKEGGMKLEELQGVVKKHFGLESFDPGKETAFYDAGADGYYLLGRGLAPYNMFVTPISDGDGVAVVEVVDFDLASDPLMLKPLETVVYTLNNNWNGSYTFVSAVAKK